MSKSLTIDYGDGSKKVFFFDAGNSLSELFLMAQKTKAGLTTEVFPDRGEIRILAIQIDGYGHGSSNIGTWVLTLNGTEFRPDVKGFENGPLNDGDSIVFTFKGE